MPFQITHFEHFFFEHFQNLKIDRSKHQGPATHNFRILIKIKEEEEKSEEKMKYSTATENCRNQTF